MKNTEFSRKLDQIFGKEQLHDEGFLDFVLKKTGNKQNLGRLKRSVLFYVDNIDSGLDKQKTPAHALLPELKIPSIKNGLNHQL